METVEEIPRILPYSSLEPFKLLEDKSSDSDPVNAVAFVGLCLVLGIACRHALRGTMVPYTVALIIIGIALGSLEYGTNHKLGRIGDGIRLWAGIDPDLLLAVFLPALLFESAFSMEVQQIKRCMAQMLLLAGPGVLMTTFCLGSAMKLTFPYEWNWTTYLLLGGLLSATDPVAVIAVLKELAVSKKLSTLIEGESVMNDGIAIVVFQLFYKMVLGQSFTWVTLIAYLAKVSLGAVVIGIAFGIASVLWLGFIFNDTVIEISLTLAVSYVAYFTAQIGLDVSGILAVMTLGMFYAAFARTAFKGNSQKSVHHFWEMVAYIANTLIFILSAVIIAESVLGNDKIFENHGYAWGYLILLYIFVQVSRCIVVGALWPFLQYFGYGLGLKEAIIISWSGLRGAVSLSLALSVKNSSQSSSALTSETGSLFVFFTGGIVLLTLIVNGSTTQFILHLLGMDKLSVTKKRIVDYTKYEMLNKALEAFEDLGDDEELGPTDWPTVKKYMACLNDLEGDPVHPHCDSRSEENFNLSNLKDIRIRLLNGVQAAYWGMLDEGRIMQTAANILMQSVDEAIDLASHEPLCDWKDLKANVNFPNYCRFLQTRIFPQKLITYFIVERLESACCICAAFLWAHKIARRELHDFLGESNIASTVINESETEGEEPRKFLDDVRLTFPQVLHVVKTRQVTYLVLNHLIDYVQNLQKVGLLDEKEVLHLQDAVQTDLKKLLRNPRLVKIPKGVHPFLGSLPSARLEQLDASKKEIIKTRGVSLYKEGSEANGIWLISNGVVKLTSKSTGKKQLLHPTFTHGSTLGLYEVLVGKPYICDLITDTVILCLFLESDKIFQILRSDPAVENLLWQESAIVLAKLLLPQVFENVGIQVLRALVIERSIMKTHLRRESIEVPLQSVGLLLEGFVKSHDVQGELITSPAVLLPLHGNQSFQSVYTPGSRAATSSHHGRYQVEARARGIFIDISSLEVDHTHRSLNRDHSGLMTWPELNQGETNQTASSLPARATQVSIFGSVADARRHGRSFSTSNVTDPSNQDRPLVSVRSEGSSTIRKNLVRKLTGQGRAETLNTAS